MPFTLTMPKLSPTMEEGTIVKWHKKVGEFAQAGDLLIEVATDKATVEFNALDEGWLRKIIVAENGEASVNQPIAIFSEEEHESIEEAALTQETQASAPSAVQEQAPVAAPVAKEAISSDRSRVMASPLAKRLAKERKINLQGIRGTGPNGRIMSRDLASAGEHVEVGVTFGHDVEEALTPMRKTIAKRLQQAKATIPHFYLTQAVDMEALLLLREEMKSNGIAATINDMIVKAVAVALAKHPTVNSGYNEEKNCLIRFGSIDISVAVTVAGGLITPIVRNANTLSVVDISAQIKELSSRAKLGKLQEHEYKGGSFTVSNLGMYGITSFAAIINPPQSAILAIGGVQEQPVVKEGAIVPGKIMNMTLSADHRVVDGVAGAEFLRTLKHILEHPVLLVV